LIDEMTLGLAPVVVERLAPALRAIAADHEIAVLLVEQHVSTALDLSDRAYLLSHGQLLLEGPAHEFAQRRDLVAASYLGQEALETTRRRTTTKEES
jgi:branched-chain amino acid transport system ATP-binding protein